MYTYMYEWRAHPPHGSTGQRDIIYYYIYVMYQILDCIYLSIRAYVKEYDQEHLI
jgi:hypothetical protein